MRALSVRQPWAELILRGVKTVEYRSRPTRVIGERFWIYASKGKVSNVGGGGSGKAKVWSRDLAVPGARPPRWMLELAEQLRLVEPGLLLPTGVIVGSAVIARVTPVDPPAGGEMFAWHLADVRRAPELRKPHGHPQPVWFTPF